MTNLNYLEVIKMKRRKKRNYDAYINVALGVDVHEQVSALASLLNIGIGDTTAFLIRNGMKNALPAYINRLKTKIDKLNNIKDTL